MARRRDLRSGPCFTLSGNHATSHGSWARDRRSQMKKKTAFSSQISPCPDPGPTRRPPVPTVPSTSSAAPTASRGEIQKKQFWLEFWLEKPLEFWLEFQYKSSKMGRLDMLPNQNGISSCFSSKNFYIELPPRSLTRSTSLSPRR